MWYQKFVLLTGFLGSCPSLIWRFSNGIIPLGPLSYYQWYILLFYIKHMLISLEGTWNSRGNCQWEWTTVFSNFCVCLLPWLTTPDGLDWKMSRLNHFHLQALAEDPSWYYHSNSISTTSIMMTILNGRHAILLGVHVADLAHYPILYSS